MHELAIPRELHNSLLTNGSNYISLNFNFMNMEFDRYTVNTYRWLQLEPYQWLNENVGEHSGCYRLCHRFYSRQDEIDKFRKQKIKTVEDWEALNPEVSSNRWSRWTLFQEKLLFADAKDAAHFKLTWF